MDINARLPRSVVPPSPEEAAALKLAGDYLVRAGSAAAKRLFCSEDERDAEALADLCDGLLAGALLCAKLTELPGLDQHQL